MEGSTVVEPTHGLARNALGLPQVLFCIVTGCAPIAAMLFNDYWAVYGGGWAAPSAFIMATLAFTVFSVGYVAMARRVTAAGGFYSFTSHGFGQSAGMGVALLIAACYTLFAAGVTGVTAYFANATFNDWFSVDIPVWVWEFGTLAIMLALAYFHIELTAKILGVFLAVEVTALLVFAFATLFQPKHGLVLDSLLPWNFFDSTGNGTKAAFKTATVGAGFFGAFWSWIGFEMAPNYAEESRNPKKIMGPATYISVIGLGVLYTFVCWMLVVAYGKAGIIPGIQAQAAGDVASVFYPATDRAMGLNIGGESILTRAFELTIVTGSFACQLAFFNTATRYFFSMGREGVLPRSLGRTHPVHHSPVNASALVGVFSALIMGGFLLYNSSALGALFFLGTWVPMMGNMGILSVMALVSVAIIRYFATTAREEQHWWTTIVAPILAAAAMVVATYLLIKYRTTLGGASGVPFVTWMWLPPLIVFVLGIVLAQLYKTRDRARFEGIGRYLHEDA
ncbi:MAG: APC family permease [Actinomycetota bacterium]|nr:APC family permease [Actinomycetota bacterium]